MALGLPIAMTASLRNAARNEGPAHRAATQAGALLSSRSPSHSRFAPPRTLTDVKASAEANSSTPGPKALAAIIGTKTSSLPMLVAREKPTPRWAPCVIASRLSGPKARFSAKHAGRKTIGSNLIGNFQSRRLRSQGPDQTLPDRKDTALSDSARRIPNGFFAGTTERQDLHAQSSCGG